MIALVVVLGVAMLVAFVALEERGRPDIAVFTIVGITVLDALFYPQQESVPLGLFRPALGGQDLRAVDVLIVAAFGARFLVRGLPRRVSAEGLIWSCTFVWYAFAALIGVARHQPSELLLFQLKFVLETGMMLALVAGVPFDLLASRRTINRLAVIGGAVSLVAVGLAISGISLSLPFPADAQIGQIKPDAATLLFTLGAIVLVSSAFNRRASWVVLVGGAVMTLAPVVADQRAAIVGVIPVVLLAAFAMNGRTWRRRSGVRIAALLPVAAAILVPLGVLAVAAASDGTGTTSLPLTARLSDTFGSEQKQQSADIRFDLLDEGLRLVGERPVLGHGLGQPVRIVDQGADSFILIGDFHNIVVDLAVRTGVVGLVLFAIGVVVSLRAALGRWRDLVDNAHAALVLAAGAALAGLVVKGLFETIFQKFRLAVLLGLLIGIVASAARAPRHQVVDRTEAHREPAWT